MVVDSVNMLDGNVYLVSQGDNIKPAGATDFDNVINNKIGRASCRERV